MAANSDSRSSSSCSPAAAAQPGEPARHLTTAAASPTLRSISRLAEDSTLLLRSPIQPAAETIGKTTVRKTCAHIWCKQERMLPHLQVMKILLHCLGFAGGGTCCTVACRCCRRQVQGPDHLAAQLDCGAQACMVRMSASHAHLQTAIAEPLTVCAASRSETRTMESAPAADDSAWVRDSGMGHSPCTPDFTV